MLRLLLYALLFLLASFSYSFSEDFWKKTEGPYGGIGKAVAGDEDMMYFATYDNLYRSDNRGETWERIEFSSTIVAGYTIERLFRIDGRTFLLASQEGGSDIFYKPDDNTDFEIITGDLAGSSVRSLEIFDDQGQLILTACTENGLWYSPDFGETWTRFEGFPEIANVQYVYGFEKTSDGDLYAGTGAGVLKSEDEGVTWTLSTEGIELGTWGYVDNIASIDAYLLATTPSTVYESTDFGDTWTEIENIPGPGGNTAEIEIIGTDIYLVKMFGGIGKSTNFGADWTVYYDQNARDMAKIGDEIFTAVMTGLIVTYDEGETWTSRNTGVNEVPSSAIVFNSDGDAIVGTDNGVVFMETPAGEWTEAASLEFGINDFARAPDGTLYAGTQWGGVFLSDDEGETWTESSEPLTDPDVKAVAVRDDGVVFAATFSDVFWSADRGENWTQMINGQQSVISLDMEFDGEGNLFVSTQYYGVVLVKAGSQTLDQPNEGLDNNRPTKFAVGPGGEMHCIAGARLMKISDDLESWVLADDSINFSRVFWSANSGFLATAQGGSVMRSESEDFQWTNVSDGIGDAFAYQFATDDEDYAYAVTSSGVFKSREPLQVSSVEEDVVVGAARPNPTNGTLFLDCSPAAAIAISDMIGNKIDSPISRYESGAEIDLTGLPSGVYYVRIYSGSGSTTIPVVKR